ncbi:MULTISPECIES: AbrB/MazE/SpoVT family DNA-binding domain-containing protein [Bacillus]|uniref:AbrB/MazE/SpoVT family DNA-binding domain-containing protein n=1 Tax=Bacillus TaxID=1386 RepID=UPI00047B752C|nr:MULTISPECIES: AbrB/MazE/SpoVT family DNA-binding domain-containing protein [Bacillus]QHZ45557.1 AbrB/MazE/SpoVT family DNA-binding domain-containing protein [Bacillus sp. NSP9.1]WFA04639.1 AbrB/MazE/SpoVT family DNA-binding domain-containing protein [Bacillus sp. HSf4]
MKNTGIVRRIDELGRVVLPVEMRKVLNINEKDPLEIYSEGESIILTKYAANMACLMTGEITTQNKTYAGGKIVLSPRGAEMLLQEMKEVLKQKHHAAY